jgi:hypothetical protein
MKMVIEETPHYRSTNKECVSTMCMAAAVLLCKTIAHWNSRKFYAKISENGRKASEKEKEEDKLKVEKYCGLYALAKKHRVYFT